MQYDVKDSNPSEKDQNAIFIGASNLNGVMIASHNFFQLFCCNPLAYELFNGKSFDGHIVLNNFWLPMDYREQCMENAEETMWAIGLEEGTIAGLLSQCSGRSPIPKSQDSIDNLQTDAQKQRNKFLANTSTIGNFKAKKTTASETLTNAMNGGTFTDLRNTVNTFTQLTMDAVDDVKIVLKFLFTKWIKFCENHPYVKKMKEVSNVLHHMKHTDERELIEKFATPLEKALSVVSPFRVFFDLLAREYQSDTAIDQVEMDRVLMSRTFKGMSIDHDIQRYLQELRVLNQSRNGTGTAL
jgi:hypothetical protein